MKAPFTIPENSLSLDNIHAGLMIHLPDYEIQLHLKRFHQYLTLMK